MWWEGFLWPLAVLGILISFWQCKKFPKFYYLASCQSNYIHIKLFWKYLLAQPGKNYWKLSLNILQEIWIAHWFHASANVCTSVCLRVWMDVYVQGWEYLNIVCSHSRCAECLASRWASIKRKAPKVLEYHGNQISSVTINTTKVSTDSSQSYLKHRKKNNSLWRQWLTLIESQR